MTLNNFPPCMFNFQKKAAYSLIEIIVVITIILLFTGMGLAAYGRFNNQRQVDAESKMVLTLLETARSKAMNSDIDAQSLTACEFEGYRLTVNPSAMSRKYSLYIKCNNTTTLVSETDMRQTLTIETQPINPIDIDFAAASGGSETCTETGCSITIKNTGVGRCRVITVQKSGVIDERDCP